MARRKKTKKEKQEMSEKESDVQKDEDGDSEVGDNPGDEDTQTKPDAKSTKGRNSRKKRRNQELKSKATGVGLKISFDRNPTPSNKKIVFDDTNLPTANEDSSEESSHDAKDESREEVGNDDDGDDDDAVEEVQGKTARDEALDQIKTEAQQSLKAKKKRNRKPRIKKSKPAPSTKSEGGDSDGDDEMDEDFFAELEAAREVELEKKRELEKSLARAKGKHTTFVFERNKGDMEGDSDPIQVDDNIQVVVLKNPSSTSETTGIGSFTTDTAISKRALMYSRNSLNDGSDRMAGEAEMKRKRNRSGEVIQPWKRVRPRLAMGRSRLKKGRPAACFKKNRR